MTRKRTRRRRRRRVSRFVLNFMLILCMSLATVLGATIFFKVEDIFVEGNSHYGVEEIIGATGIQLGENIFTIPREEISEKITYSLPYIQSIQVKFSLPTGIRLVVQEQIGMVKLVTGSGSWYMGLQGKLLEKVNEFTPYVSESFPQDSSPEVESDNIENAFTLENMSHSTTEFTEETTQEDIVDAGSESSFLDSLIPQLDWNTSPDYVLDLNPEDPILLVTGLELVEPSPGQMVQVSEENAKQVTALLALFQELETYNLFSEISNIHVHAFQYFEISYGDRFLVKFPFDGDYSYKIRALISAVSKVEHYETGTMDLTYDHYAVLFTPD